ncbi:MAG: biotin--[acetyl-CoA-carboxylase] ligase [Candidatus Krumholzibacteriales bacterium]
MIIDELHPGLIKKELRSLWLGRVIILYDRIGSTNDPCFDLGRSGFPEGTVVSAAEQVKGRGRKGRVWFSSREGGLVFSVLLRPGEKREGLMTLFSFSVIEYLESEGIGAMMKWPNDIYIGGKKAGGILAEGRKDFVVLGAGLNVNETESCLHPEIIDLATSLRIEQGMRFDRGALLRDLLELFEKNYLEWKNSGLKPFLPRIRGKVLYIGERISVLSGNMRWEGRFSGISDQGYLLLETGYGIETIHSGDLSVERKQK